MPEQPSATPSLRDALARIAATALSLVHTRLALASVELAEERDRLKQVLALLVVAALCAAFALLGATLFVVAYYWDTHRFRAIAGVTIFYAAVAAAAWWRAAALRRAAPAPFAATLAELDKDRRSIIGEPRA